MLLSRIELENLLSFKHLDFEMRPLNVLVGPNASGKSNLIRSLSLIQALPKRGLSQAIADGGGSRSWINRRTGGVASIHIEGSEEPRFDYTLSFQEAGQSWAIDRETYANVFERRQEQVSLGTRGNTVMQTSIASNVSVLSEIRHPSEPALAKLADAFNNIRLYREFVTGPRAQARSGTSSSLLADHLDEDGANLALRLGEMDLQIGLHTVNRAISRLFELFSEVKVSTRGGITQLYVREKGIENTFAATSLSDGTLRLLCLLTVLLDPTPPPLICIEEPETGLHPDAIRDVAGLLVEASSRTQVVVTTHSPALIDALSDQPEAVAVCERDFDGFTQIRRLQGSKLTEWLERYTLGELWQKGEIGGNRW
jgi:predicted ATPase